MIARLVRGVCRRVFHLISSDDERALRVASVDFAAALGSPTPVLRARILAAHAGLYGREDRP